MEAYPVIASADEYPEVLACASVDGTFYYFDPFYDAMATNGRGLMGFGMVVGRTCSDIFRIRQPSSGTRQGRCFFRNSEPAGAAVQRVPHGNILELG